MRSKWRGAYASDERRDGSRTHVVGLHIPAALWLESRSVCKDVLRVAGPCWKVRHEQRV